MKVVAVNEKGYRIGESHHNAKLTDEEIDMIFYLHEQGLGTRTIAAKFDDGKTISRTTVRNVLRGRKRAQIPDRYKRVP
jgi:IS30 family transposase